jgi:hypothetical protein
MKSVLIPLPDPAPPCASDPDRWSEHKPGDTEA